MELAHLREEGFGDPGGHGPQGLKESGIPGKGAGLKSAASASAEVLGLIGVMFLGVFAMR